MSGMTAFTGLLGDFFGTLMKDALMLDKDAPKPNEVGSFVSREENDKVALIRWDANALQSETKTVPAGGMTRLSDVTLTLTDLAQIGRPWTREYWTSGETWASGSAEVRPPELPRASQVIQPVQLRFDRKIQLDTDGETHEG